jgi:cytosine/uracil/thiamine/allantoin permease
MEWRKHFDGSHELWMNGTRLVQTDTVYSDQGPARSGTDPGVDWQTVAAVVVGAVLIAIIANADSVEGCIGTACPSPEPPPDSGQ